MAQRYRKSKGCWVSDAGRNRRWKAWGNRAGDPDAVDLAGDAFSRKKHFKGLLPQAPLEKKRERERKKE